MSSQHVFDIPELKQEILKYVIKDKYETELKDFIHEIVDQLIIKKWFLYCNCTLCQNKARDYFMGI